MHSLVSVWLVLANREALIYPKGKNNENMNKRSDIQIFLAVLRKLFVRRGMNVIKV
jgi:hypothetical protein